MIEHLTGDILASGAEAIVSPVNCLGVHGRGLAKVIAERFPRPCRAFTMFAQTMRTKPGDVFEARTGASTPRSILFFPTKDHWRDPSRLEYVADGLESLEAMVGALSFESVAIPALGCGLGGLSWSDVLPLIRAAAERMPCRVLVYAPGSA